MPMELNQIFSGRKTCQVVQATNLFRDRLRPHHQDCDMIQSWFMFVKQNVVCLYPVETTGTLIVDWVRFPFSSD